MDCEYVFFFENNIWELVFKLFYYKLIYNKWIYKIKYKLNGDIEKY